jgi:hypothetical protein
VRPSVDAYAGLADNPVVAKNPYEPPAATGQPRRTIPGRGLLPWVVAVAVVLVGSVLGISALLSFWPEEDGPPAILIFMPWFLSLALGWGIRRKLARLLA